MTNKTNAMTAKIVDYRYIGKMQLNADDMGGIGCQLWDNYLAVCNLLTVSAWNHTIGRATDSNAINAAIAGLFDFFGISVVDSKAYTARILAAMVERKPVRSQELKDAIKAKTAAKKALDEAVDKKLAEGMSKDDVLRDESIVALTVAAQDAKDKVDAMYLEPNNYWFDFTPMYDKKTLKAKPQARKALEDICADIFNERKFMSAEEIKAEEIALYDQRKGRKLRQKQEAKAEKSDK